MCRIESVDAITPIKDLVYYISCDTIYQAILLWRIQRKKQSLEHDVRSAFARSKYVIDISPVVHSASIYIFVEVRRRIELLRRPIGFRGTIWPKTEHGTVRRSIFLSLSLCLTLFPDPLVTAATLTFDTFIYRRSPRDDRIWAEVWVVYDWGREKKRMITRV